MFLTARLALWLVGSLCDAG